LKFVEWAKSARKFLVALAGTVALAVANGTITGDAAEWATVAIGFLTALGVYATPNVR
jgi:hypothetical protein